MNEQHKTVCVEQTGPTLVESNRPKMMRILVLFASVTVLAAAHDIPQSAVAHLEGKFKGSVVKGDLVFTRKAQDKIAITGTITGMPPGKYAINIHEKGDISNNCANIQGHFNPHGHDHGHPDHEHRHVGDLGNIEFDKSGVAKVNLADRLIKFEGTENILGRSIALASGQDDHGQTDHETSKIDGGAGEIVACGVIRAK